MKQFLRLLVLGSFIFVPDMFAEETPAEHKIAVSLRPFVRQRVGSRSDALMGTGFDTSLLDLKGQEALVVVYVYHMKLNDTDDLKEVSKTWDKAAWNPVRPSEGWTHSDWSQQGSGQLVTWAEIPAGEGYPHLWLFLPYDACALSGENALKYLVVAFDKNGKEIRKLQLIQDETVRFDQQQKKTLRGRSPKLWVGASKA